MCQGYWMRKKQKSTPMRTTSWKSTRLHFSATIDKQSLVDSFQRLCKSQLSLTSFGLPRLGVCAQTGVDSGVTGVMSMLCR
jgi:hypothetical protein